MSIFFETFKFWIEKWTSIIIWSWDRVSISVQDRMVYNIFVAKQVILICFFPVASLQPKE
jgi:hypothetical protein